MIDSIRTADVLAFRYWSPLYEAWIALPPIARVVVASTALPRRSGAVPRTFVPSVNVTVPVGVPLTLPTTFTVAVSLMLFPTRATFRFTVSVVFEPKRSP